MMETMEWPDGTVGVRCAAPETGLTGEWNFWPIAHLEDAWSAIRDQHAQAVAQMEEVPVGSRVRRRWGGKRSAARTGVVTESLPPDPVPHFPPPLIYPYPILCNDVRFDWCGRHREGWVRVRWDDSGYHTWVYAVELIAVSPLGK